MNDKAIIFNKNAEKVAFDKGHRQKINFNISQYDRAVVNGKQRYDKLEIAKQRAANIKHKTLAQLDKYLVEFETNFTQNGGKVLWARHAEEACAQIVKLLKEENIKKVVKSKSMTTEEIKLNDQLEMNGIQSLETDLGEFIVQLAGEKPYHIVTPAMHKSRQDVADLYHQKFQIDPQSTPEQITAYTRSLLRDEFQQAGAGITGANFLLADIGGIALTENEGNGLMSMAFPKIHIVIAGIEKILPSVDDLNLFWPLLATHGTGQHMTVYNSIVTAARHQSDSSTQMVVVLLDNGRSKLLEKSRQRSALSCIRCGACLNVCPVYKNIGGYTYDTTYTGPIGSVITPHMQGMKENKHLSFASSLCGACTEVCPVKIPLHELLLLNRAQAVSEGWTLPSERFVMKNATRVLKSRKLVDFAGSSTKNLVLKYFFASQWGDKRTLPKFAKKSFSQLWRERNE
ncbi:MAG: lactate utilization protein [Bacteroidales bacterium]|jgi:L-lactate dehydrogenase complex protein LldF|nr:lactate utilization protein [Bacteroidales bacterium]MDN5349717.1 L-lactate dehydrogenase complex protein LldF [Bacteroidales bacterium]